MSIMSRPRKASMAAAPVSPEVAPTIVARAPLPQQRAVHQPRHHLHGEILEGERRPVKQLEQPARGRNLAERRDGRVMEAAIGLVEHGLEVAEARIALEIGAHDAVGGFAHNRARRGRRSRRAQDAARLRADRARRRGQDPQAARPRREAPALRPLCSHTARLTSTRDFKRLAEADRVTPPCSLATHIDDIDDHKAKGEEKPGDAHIADGCWEDRAWSGRPAASRPGYRSSRASRKNGATFGAPSRKHRPASWRQDRARTSGSARPHCRG